MEKRPKSPYQEVGNVECTQIRGFQVGPVPGRSTLHQREVRLLNIPYFQGYKQLLTGHQRLCLRSDIFN